MIFEPEYRDRAPRNRGISGLAPRLHVDPPLFVALLALTGLGLAILFSASGESTTLMSKQGVRLGIAFAVMFVMAQIPGQTLYRWSAPVFLIGTSLLVLVLLLGVTGKGAQRWLDLGFIRFQPSEIMKLAVPIAVARFIHDHGMPPRYRHVLAVLAILGIPAALIAQQPDLGTALLVATAGLSVLFIAGLSWLTIALLGGAATAALPLLWLTMHDYQRQRVLTLLDPEKDPLGSGYHIIQSKIALGSGGLFGKGWLNGSQAHLQFLPERSTDFIFAVYGEEFGFLGLIMLLIIYLVIILRGMQIAASAQSTFERLLAAGLSLTFFVYVFVNTGMVTGILPVVGVPLPLVSYGGTSMVTLMASFGILMSIQTHRKLLAQ
ncbi:MAG: rod shape-determining protein RodA [Pseudomonadota bacterium]|nr:rod shape-determining protein RodA [Pseudomonadota bacterium]